MLLAQITDTHIVDPATDAELFVDNNQRLALAVARLNAETIRPEAVLATGDLTENGTVAEMRALAELLDPLNIPVLALPGNHDRRSTFRDTFHMPWATDDGHLGWVVDLSELRVIGLDTVVPDSDRGLLDAERSRWLADALDEAGDRPTAIAMHHPPFHSGIHWMDAMPLDGMDTFSQIVAGRKNLTRIFCGHLHRPLVSTVGGVTTTVGISTVVHVELNLDPAAPVELIRDPVGYQLHRFDGTHWVTHTRYIDTGEVPIRPSS